MEEEMNTAGMPRADWGSMGDPDFKPIVSVHSGGRDHELTGLECGPAAGICIQAYSKYGHRLLCIKIIASIRYTNFSRACHYEPTPKKAPYIVSYTTCFTPEESGLGGNFYVQPIGLLVKASTDTLIIHRGDVNHGTTVHDGDHKADEFGLDHRGFTMFCKYGLPTLWKQRVLTLQGQTGKDAKGRITYTEAGLAALTPEERKKHLRVLSQRAKCNSSHVSSKPDLSEANISQWTRSEPN